MSDKIGARHLSRKALVYVRQSTPRQLSANTESRQLQYRMREQLLDLGFKTVEVIDEDLGRSASGTVTRTGFERMLAEVSLGDIGVVAARELSRFSRNNREWQQLVEVCRFVDTLLLDQDTVYDPRSGNDRLLLGLKGNLSEYELELLRVRAAEARIAKAKRGAFVTRPCVGYIKVSRDGRLEKNPDQRIQRAITLLFSKALELGSAHGAMTWFIEQGLQIPVGKANGEVNWRSPDYTQVLRMLRNPTYAGAYVYGRRKTTNRLKNGKLKKGFQRVPQEEWLSLHYDHHEAYITREDFERLGKMIDKNRQNSAGAVKKGAALLNGLLRCKRCGRKLGIQYQSRKRGPAVHRYICGKAAQFGKPMCLGFSGVDIDARISELLLDAVKPAAIEASLSAFEAQKDERKSVLRSFESELTAARYEADRARRQFDASDPENRLVTGELERRWEIALSKVSETEQRKKAEESRLSDTTPIDKESFVELGRNLSKVWNAPRVDARLKKRIARTLIQEIVVSTSEDNRAIEFLVHWKGGVHTQHSVKKHPAGRKRSAVRLEVITAIKELAHVCDDTDIAKHLNSDGYRRPGGDPWTRAAIRSLRSKHQIACHSRGERQAAGYLILEEASQLAGVSVTTLRKCARRNELPALHPLPHGPWIFRAKDVTVWATLHAEKKSKPAEPNSKQLSLEISGMYQGGAV